ncbi:MAG: YdcF family protein [Firmicutes bacterium]|nr:YdcF family protein [Bacillota bacterium]
MILNRKQYLLIAVVFFIISAAYIQSMGDNYVLKFELPEGKTAEDYEVTAEKEGVVEITGITEDNGVLKAHLSSVFEGKTYIDFRCKDETARSGFFKIYVHRTGIITEDFFFGKCTGGWIIPVAVIGFLVIVFFSVLAKYKAGVGENMYSYRNVMNLGLLIYLLSLILYLVIVAMGHRSVMEMLQSIMGSADTFSTILLPFAFIVFLIVTLSNLRLMKMEGRNWHNMLGFILGICICAGTLLPGILGDILQRSTVVDVHNENGVALYAEIAIEGIMTAIVSYLECMLLGTVFFGIKAARHVPAFDKDYMMILGCQIKDDGTPTNLLKGRADRAVEFARMQKEATGKEVIFVPSGGKGSDEKISEAESVKNYLLSLGIREELIMPECESANTEENFRNSLKLILEDAGIEDPKVAFSTTNYHVFRSGLLASEQGIYAEGIGSRTRSYFWINAFVREFIATLAEERKKHLRIIAVLVAAIIVMAWMLRLSNIL